MNKLMGDKLGIYPKFDNLQIIHPNLGYPEIDISDIRKLNDKFRNYLLNTELSSMDRTYESFNDNDDYDLLLENIKESFIPLLGEDHTQWLLEELRAPRHVDNN